MRIAVCDDESRQIDIITEYIKMWSKNQDETVEIFACSSAAEFLYYWSENQTFDLLFLDIRMKSMTGLELARIIRKNDDKLIIVFITGLKNYVFQGYEVQAMQYLLKPVKASVCFDCLDRARKVITSQTTETLVIPYEKQSVRLFYKEIYSFEIYSHYIEVNSKKGKFSFKKKIEELEQELPRNIFFRCHRSYIVNLRYVNTIGKTDLLMDNDVRIPVSKNRWDATNEAFLSYYAGGTKI